MTEAQAKRPDGPTREVLDWLLEEDQPSVRYLTLTQLRGKSEKDSEVKRAKARIPSVGWVAQALSRREPGGWWVRDGGRMEPRFLGTHWTLLALADLGATREIPEVRESCEYWMKKSPLVGGGVGGLGRGKGSNGYWGFLIIPANLYPLS
ncbi:MAG: hypothetical protein KGJ23_16260 [Euryarchaeota archaeon]|nr:hypothetical protein [Euryarchaeota archaeon]MDE1838153.1 hypothetical protein [Euryarchaeota archaeon]MDE1879020.1 hypothetical protein [Euryarchaeota archaeon]MDE2046628.1 hypothetical protein [Thermoplasmata archaeon]